MPPKNRSAVNPTRKGRKVEKSEDYFVIISFFLCTKIRNFFLNGVFYIDCYFYPTSTLPSQQFEIISDTKMQEPVDESKKM